MYLEIILFLHKFKNSKIKNFILFFVQSFIGFRLFVFTLSNDTCIGFPFRLHEKNYY